MTIITIENRESSIDIGINKEQRIVDTLSILMEHGYPVPENLMYIKLERTNTWINSLLTFEEANVFHGDKLIIK